MRVRVACNRAITIVALAVAFPGLSGCTTGSGARNQSVGGGGASGADGGAGGGGGRAADGRGDANTGSGGSRDGAANDRGTDAGDATDGALHGGTSGRYICPPGASYAGVTPALSGAVSTASGPAGTPNAEGPIWVAPLGALLFTSSQDQGADIRQIWRLSPPGLDWISVKTNVGNNGMTLDPDNKIVSADHQMSAVVRLEPATGAVIEVIAGTYLGNHFRSPNDVIVRGDGNIYFSDPEYAVSRGPVPKVETTAFYRISPPPARQVSVVEDTGHRDPNGIALSPDDNTLYTLVAGDRLIKRWSLNADGSISGAGTTHVAQTGPTPDGMCVDCAGNLYVGTQTGLEVYSPTGARIVTLLEGSTAINCSFGGSDHKTLFVTGDAQIRFAATTIPGLP
ncbi:MAG TPA: SMP-30/gluconolactonase/LRE family protein [Polyangia bacterium]|nr:SMP-30/gluconolactonase/LRE family protein [Polyangia bacterium]